MTSNRLRGFGGVGVRNGPLPLTEVKHWLLTQLIALPRICVKGGKYN